MRARFGDFILDLNRRELTVEGEIQHLSTKAFLLLEFLVQNAPRALTREELYRHIWGDTFVEQVNLPNLISEVRGVLGESRKSPRFIKTIHAYGYAFAAEVFIESDSQKASNRKDVRVFSIQWGREEYPLKNGANILGRDEGADVIIDSRAVSRRHARLVVSGGAVTIEDLGSKNGTSVGGGRIQEPVVLHDGDEIRIGYVSLLFRAANGRATTVTAMSRSRHS
jgi:DNA-binding winged helix-turn-helix (wHTH) protein